MRYGVAALLAIALLTGRAAAQQEPSRADLAARLSQGDAAWEREDHPAARAAYDAVVRADSSFSSRALYRVGLLHAWDNRFGPALSALRLYVRLEPDDLTGRVALARAYAWASRFDVAIAEYDSILSRDARFRDAVVGRAQTLAWRDDIPAAERSLEAWLEQRPDDAGAWTLLGQFRRWRGDARGARTALEYALARAPEDRDAREQMAWVRTELAPSVALTLVGAKDSEDNTLWHRELTYEMAGIGNSRIGVAARLREASVTDNDAMVMPGVTAFVSGRPGGRNATTRLELGLVQYPEGLGAAVTRARGALRVSGSPRRGLRLSGGATVEPFDEVLSTARRAMTFGFVDLDATYALHPRWQLGLAGSVGQAKGEALGTEPGRTTVLGSLRYAPKRGRSFALSHREVAWSEPQFGVFFAPQRWATTELSYSGERAADLGLILAADLGVASQWVGFDGGELDQSIVPRGTVRIGYRPLPGREILLGYTYANVAGSGAITASDYRYNALTLGGRWTF